MSTLAEAIQRAGRPTTREIDEEIKRLRTELAGANAYLLRLQNAENKLSQEVATEQDRWAEINQRLEELDRALTRR